MGEELEKEGELEKEEDLKKEAVVVKTPGKEEWCFVEGTDIITSISAKSIEDVAVGEKVCNASGSLCEVQDIYKRSYVGKILTVNPRYLPRVTVTPEHLFFVKDGTSFQWVPACDLTQESILVFPKVMQRKFADVIDLANYPIRGCRVDNKYIYRGSKVIPRMIEPSSNFGELLGWYAAEGCLDKYNPQIIFTLGSREREQADYIVQLLKEVFNLSSSIRETQRNGLEIRTHSRVVWKFLKDNFGLGKAYQKTLPAFLFDWPKDLVEKYLYAYWQGDGHETSETLCFSTSSKQLMWSTFLLCSQLGTIPTITEYTKDRRFPSFIQGRYVKATRSHYLLTFSKSCSSLFGLQQFRNPFYQQDERYFYIPIRGIESRQHEGNVYNLETSSGTYVASVAVHNCVRGHKKDKSGKYRSYGCYPSRAQAEKRLKQIQYFKYKGARQLQRLERQAMLSKRALGIGDFETGQLGGKPIVPVCCVCNKARDKSGNWHDIQFASDQVNLSHTCCPPCAKKLYPDLFT